MVSWFRVTMCGVIYFELVDCSKRLVCVCAIHRESAREESGELFSRRGTYRGGRAGLLTPDPSYNLGGGSEKKGKDNT